MPLGNSFPELMKASAVLTSAMPVARRALRVEERNKHAFSDKRGSSLCDLVDFVLVNGSSLCDLVASR